MYFAGIALAALLQVAASSETFLETAREASAVYRDRSIAILAGYRRIGDDFPAMGEHWIHVGRVFDGIFDPRLPEVLTYVSLDGIPTLAGVAWALPLLEGESPPSWPVDTAMWHDHHRTLEEETLLPAHDRPGDPSGARIAMLHAWVWLPNPEGVFAADNWAVPYIRTGVDPSGADPVAGRALSLPVGGESYFSEVAREASGEDALPEAAVARFAEARAEVESLLASRPDFSMAETDRLTSLWQALWNDVRMMLGAEARERLDAVDLGLDTHSAR